MASHFRVIASHFYDLNMIQASIFFLTSCPTLFHLLHCSLTICAYVPPRVFPQALLWANLPQAISLLLPLLLGSTQMPPLQKDFP